MLVKPEVDAFSPAATLLRALRRRDVSSRELLAAHLDRVDKFDPALNSVVVKDFDRARADADAADQRRMKGEELPLLGLPVTIKESIDVEGLPSTAGALERKGHTASADARTVARLRAAGAVVFGKTNVCTWLADYQADNPVYGRTNSPWDLGRTPGGSSGGSATLAAGLTPLDIGSDLGGSIRVPAAFCGLWGHKPSETAVPNSGHFPGSDRPNSAAVMAVQGPHARSATDLQLAFNVMSGPDVGMDAAWSLQMPSPRHQTLRDFRVAVLPLQAWLPVDVEIVEALERLTHELQREGAVVREFQPPGLGDLREHYALFRSMMWAIVSIRWPMPLRRQVVADKLARGEEFHAADARGILAAGADYLLWHERRETYRAAWREFFKHWDILLTPMTLTPAFEHSTVPNADRRLCVNGQSVEFEYTSFYPSIATLSGQPATALPAGFTSRGLPMGMQAVGPFLEDHTTIQFAKLLEEQTGGFCPPPGYTAELL